MNDSGFLFATPSFLTGLARTLDIGATLSAHSYNMSETPREADVKALASDWSVVGLDIAKAIEQSGVAIPDEK